MFQVDWGAGSCAAGGRLLEAGAGAAMMRTALVAAALDVPVEDGSSVCAYSYMAGASSSESPSLAEPGDRLRPRWRNECLMELKGLGI